MSSARDVARAQAKQRDPIPLSLGTVTAVDLDAKTATVLRDGVSFTIYPDASGRLPLLGARAWMTANGADVIVLGGEMLADGVFQSPGWLGPDGDQGWGMDSDGNLFAASGVFRGTVEGALFRTAASGPRVEISSEEAGREVRFFTGDDDEVTPGVLRSYDDDDQLALELLSPTVDEDDTPGSVLITVDRADGSTSLDFVGDNIRSNGVSISRPPYSAKKRVAGLSVGTSTTDYQAIVWDTDLHVANDSEIALSGATWTVTRSGIYALHIIWGWDDQATNAGGREVRVVENGEERGMDTMQFVQGRRAFHNCQTDILIPTDDPFTVQAKIGQNSGVELQGTGRGVLYRRSDY